MQLTELKQDISGIPATSSPLQQGQYNSQPSDNLNIYIPPNPNSAGQQWYPIYPVYPQYPSPCPGCGRCPVCGQKANPTFHPTFIYC